MHYNMEMPEFWFGDVGSSCPRFCVSYQFQVFSCFLVLLEGNLTVCVAFFFSFCMKPPSKKLQMDENGGSLVHIECCD